MERVVRPDGTVYGGGRPGGRFIPLRAVMRDGSRMWRGVRDMRPETLVKAFELDPVLTTFDLPRSMWELGEDGGEGRARSGRGPAGSSRMHGFILRDREPIGVIVVCREGDRFRDVDPVVDWAEAG